MTTGIADVDIHHVGQIVDDYETVVAFYEQMFDGQVRDEVSVDGKVHAAFVELPDHAVEIVCRTERGTHLDGILDALTAQSRYHVAYDVPDIDAALDGFESEGYELFNDEPVEGLGAYVRAFVSPDATPGIPIELIETRPE